MDIEYEHDKHMELKTDAPKDKLDEMKYVNTIQDWIEHLTEGDDEGNTYLGMRTSKNSEDAHYSAELFKNKYGQNMLWIKRNGEKAELQFNDHTTRGTPYTQRNAQKEVEFAIGQEEIIKQFEMGGLKCVREFGPYNNRMIRSYIISGTEKVIGIETSRLH